MADPEILFWAAIPDGSVLEANAANQANQGTFAVAGHFLDQQGNFTRIEEIPFRRELEENNTYQVSLEVLPAGGAKVDAKVTIESGGQVIRESKWNPVQGGPGLRVVFLRMEKAS